MSIRLKEENSGKVLVVSINDKLAEADYDQIVPEFDRLVRQHGQIRLFFDMTDFLGWNAGVSWGDTQFSLTHFSNISRLAIVGEKTCQHGMATFCRPFTRASVRYFERGDASKARQWLDKE